MKTSSLRAEAAQFALLRRLAPSMRHRLMGGLHPIGLLAELANRRLATEQPDVASARDSVAKIQIQARGATASSLAMLAWITGEEASSVGLNEGIEACVGLLHTDCEMRGVSISLQLTDSDVVVSRRALRTVLAASLIAAVDIAPHPTRIALRTDVHGDAVEVRIEADSELVTPTRDGGGEARPLLWEDVEALAQLEGVDVLRNSNPLIIRCRFLPFESESIRKNSNALLRST